MTFVGAASATGAATRAKERRSGRRFEIALDLRWRLLHAGKVNGSGTGRTVDLSRNGVLFEAMPRLPEGTNVELSIRWPVLLRDATSLQLKVVGEVVRSEDGCAAVRMRHHEFRTV